MSFLEIALSCIRRGWHVFPCWPESKDPLTKHGDKDASNDETQVREWWTRTPNANVAIATRPSGLTVVDVDKGLTNETGLREFLTKHDIPETLTVRTGKRPDYRVQLYFSGAVTSLNGWESEGYSGDIRGSWGYVIAPGSVHPESKERYTVLWDKPVTPVPGRVRAFKAPRKERVLGPTTPITEWRNDAMIRILGKHRADGADDESISFLAHRINETRVTNPLDEAELERIIANVCKYPTGEAEPIAVIGKPEQPKDWRSLFHTHEEMQNAKPISFLIKGFLQREGVTAIAGPVRERKSLIALNVVHALLTSEKLFDYFEVEHKPERILYLCPEVSLGPFTDRVKRIGLMGYVGERLFCRTLSAEGRLALNDPSLLPALPASVVVLDTAIRFLEGDENSSKDVRAFADQIFALLREGAESVVLLHHSPKGSEGMTLENAMRGSGDMGAFLCSCWGTKLQDPSKPYESASFLSNLKQRDFESKDFEVTSGDDCRLHIIGDPETRAVSLQPRTGNRGNKDGLDETAEAVIRAKGDLPVRKLQEQLAALNINRGTTWIAKAKARIQAAEGRTVVAG